MERASMTTTIAILKKPASLASGRTLRWLLSYRLHFTLMVLFLPWMSGLVIDIGGNLRLTYLFGVMTFLSAWREGRLRWPTVNAGTVCVVGLLLYSAISTLFTLWIPQEKFDNIVPSGFRLTPFRSLVQLGQLGLMVGIMYLILNHVRSRVDLKHVVMLLFWGTAIAIFYGAYQWIAAVTDYIIPYVNLNTNPDTNPARVFADTMGRWGSGVMLPRPRSLMFEPQELATFMLFGIPFACYAITLVKSTLMKVLMSGIVVLGILVFMAANSLGAFLAIPLVGLATVILTRNLVKPLLVGALVYLLMAFMIFPVVGSGFDPRTPALFYYEQVDRVLQPSQWGRDYSRPKEVFVDHPIIGVGLGNYPFYVESGRTSSAPTSDESPVYLASPFSLHLRLLVETGVIGGAIFGVFVLLVSWRLFKQRTDGLASVSLISLIGVMIASLTLDHLYVAAWLWVLMAIGIAAAYQPNDEEGVTTPSPSKILDKITVLLIYPLLLLYILWYLKKEESYDRQD